MRKCSTNCIYKGRADEREREIEAEAEEVRGQERGKGRGTARRRRRALGGRNTLPSEHVQRLTGSHSATYTIMFVYTNLDELNAFYKYEHKSCKRKRSKMIWFPPTYNVRIQKCR